MFFKHTDSENGYVHIHFSFERKPGLDVDKLAQTVMDSIVDICSQEPERFEHHRHSFHARCLYPEYGQGYTTHSE